MDTFIEQIIVCKKTPKQITLAVLTMALASVLVTFLLWTWALGAITLVLAAAVVYGTWWVLSMMNIEYEYCITNGDIDIDRITARRKRERVVSVSLQKVERVGRYVPAEWKTQQVDRRVMAAPSEKEEGLYYFTYRSKKRGHTLVVFRPNERMMEAFEAGLPRLLQKDLQK